MGLTRFYKTTISYMYIDYMAILLLINITFLIFAVLVVRCIYYRPYKPFQTVEYF